MDQGKATTLDALLPLLVTRISSATSISSAYIIPTLSEDYFDPGIGGLADKYVLISNFRGQFVEGLATGGGNSSHLWDMTLDVTMVVRLDIDEAGKDTQRLVNSTLGLLPLWRSLIKNLNQWNPDDGGVPPLGLLAQPARTYAFSITPKPYPRRHGWVQLRTKMQIVFVQDMS